MLYLKTFFVNILSMSTIASIVFLCILFARKFIKNKVNLKNYSLLWIIFIIALIIPLNFESRLSIKNYIGTNETFVLTESEEIVINQSYETNDIINENEERSKINFTEIFSIIWFIVAVSLIFKDFFIYKSLNKNKSFEIPKSLLKIFEDCKHELNIEQDIKLVVQDKIKMPSLYGIFDTQILLTKEILDFSETELKCIFIHELNHYKYNHHVLYLLFGIIEKIHWFNPIVNMAFKIIKQDLEIITDNNVLKADIKVKEYCKTILKVAAMCSLSKVQMPSICSGKKEIERRLKEMKNANKYAKASVIILGIAILTVSLITVSLASERMDNDNVELTNVNDIFEKIETEIDKEINEVEKVEYIMPIGNAKVSAKFGTRIHPITNEEIFHSGIDFAAEKGEKIKAAADGVVEVATFDTEKGNFVEIKHADGSISSYQHGSEILVEVGDSVKAGDEIMLVGSTGKSTGPHLHFEVRNKDGEYMDVNEMVND